MKTRRILSMLLAAIMVLSLVPVLSVASFAAAEDEVVRYVAFKGKDTNDGLTPQTPYASLTKATADIAAEGRGGVIVIPSRLVSTTFSFPDMGGEVLITSVWDGVDYRIKENNPGNEATGAIWFWDMGTGGLHFNSPVVIDNINIQMRNTNNIIAAQYNDITIGEGVDISLEAASKNYPIFFAGYNPQNNGCAIWDIRNQERDPVLVNQTVNISGGTWQYARAANRVAGDQQIQTTIAAGSVINFNIGGGTYLAKEGTSTLVSATSQTAFEAGSKVNFNISGGTFEGPITLAGVKYATPAHSADCDIDLTITGGTFKNNKIMANQGVAISSPNTYPSNGKMNIVIKGGTFAEGTTVYGTNVAGNTVVTNLTATPIAVDSATGVVKNDNVAFLTAPGATGDGKTAATPTGSINTAYSLLDLSRDDATIVVVGAFSWSGAFVRSGADQTGKLLVTSVYDGVDYRTSGAKITWGTTYCLNVDITFDNINAGMSAASAYIVCRNFDCTLGENFKLTPHASATGLSSDNAFVIVGNSSNDASYKNRETSEKTTLTLLGGEKLYVIPYNYNKAFKGKNPVEVVVDGNAKIGVLMTGSYGNYSDNVGDLTVTMNGGEITALCGYNTPITVNSITLNWNGGDIKYSSIYEYSVNASNKAGTSMTFTDGSTVNYSCAVKSNASFDAVLENFQTDVEVHTVRPASVVCGEAEYDLNTKCLVCGEAAVANLVPPADHEYDIDDDAIAMAQPVCGSGESVEIMAMCPTCNVEYVYTTLTAAAKHTVDGAPVEEITRDLIGKACETCGYEYSEDTEGMPPAEDEEEEEEIVVKEPVVTGTAGMLAPQTGANATVSASPYVSGTAYLMGSYTVVTPTGSVANGNNFVTGTFFYMPGASIVAGASGSGIVTGTSSFLAQVN